jgi:hypothetical protein
MYIHKYTVGEDTFYRVSKSKAGSSKIETITRDNWRGVSAGSNVANAVKFLNSLKFSKDVEKIEEKDEGKKAMAQSIIAKLMDSSKE